MNDLPAQAGTAADDETRKGILSAASSAKADLDAADFSVTRGAATLREVVKVAKDSPVGKEAKQLLEPVDRAGTLISFRVVSAFAAILVVAFGVLYIRDRRQGGYKAEKI